MLVFSGRKSWLSALIVRSLVSISSALQVDAQFVLFASFSGIDSKIRVTRTMFPIKRTTSAIAIPLTRISQRCVSCCSAPSHLEKL